MLFITSRLRYNLQSVVFSQTAISLKCNIYKLPIYKRLLKMHFVNLNTSAKLFMKHKNMNSQKEYQTNGNRTMQDQNNRDIVQNHAK